MRVLVDTATFLWLVIGSPRLSPRAVDVLQSPANDLFLSAASAWEIALKYATGRLPLPMPPERLVPAQRDAHGIESLPVDEESTLHLARLPRLHGDPFDRLLVSQAIVHGLIILTPDPLLSHYPARTLW